MFIAPPCAAKKRIRCCFDWQTAPSNRAKGTLMNGCSQDTSNVLMQVQFFFFFGILIIHQGQNYANMTVIGHLATLYRAI